MMKNYIQKPKKVEVMVLHRNPESIQKVIDWLDLEVAKNFIEIALIVDKLLIHSEIDKKNIFVPWGNFIVKNEKGELYTCNPVGFEMEYEEV